MPLENFSQDIVDTVREPLLMLDTTLRVHSANRAFYQTFHVSREETEHHLIYELGNGQWDIPDLRTLLEDVVPKSSVDDVIAGAYVELPARLTPVICHWKCGPFGAKVGLAPDVTCVR